MLARFAQLRAHSFARHASAQVVTRQPLRRLGQISATNGLRSYTFARREYHNLVPTCILHNLGKLHISSNRSFSTSTIRARGKEDDLNDSEMNQFKEFLKESTGATDRRMRDTMEKLEDAMHAKPKEDEYNPYKDVNEEIDPFADDPHEPAPYKTLYLPSNEIDDMIKSGFLKNVHDLDPLADEPVPEAVDALPLKEKLFLKKFFMKLQLAKAHPSASSTKMAWKLFQYIYTKPHLAKLLNDSAWKLVWALDNEPIPTHRKVAIGNLMLHVEADMTEKQWISYIEALFWHGQRDQAMQYWSLGLEDKPSILWYSVGARLLATEHLPEEAEKVIQAAIDAKGKAVPKLFIPAIVCYHQLSEESKLKDIQRKHDKYNAKALRVYHKMLQFCPKIQQKEFLRVALSFLDAGYFKDAIMVYEHMLNIYPRLIDDHSTSDYWDLKFKDAAVRAQNEAVNEAELQDLTVSALRKLPSDRKGVILLGNWMRNLIRMNRIENALRIAREMQNLHIQMDTSTYNLLLMLFDEHGKVGKLEFLAARMIRNLLEPMFAHNATFEQVLHDKEFQPTEDQNNEFTVRSAFHFPPDIEEILARFEQRPQIQLPLINEIRPKPLTDLAEEIFADIIKHEHFIPRADPATFSLLLNRSVKSFNILKASSVLQLLAKAKMPLNRHIIEPLLKMLIRKRAYDKLFETYNVISDPGVFDFRVTNKTFVTLFHGLCASYKMIQRPDGLPTPRELFTDMVQRSDTVRMTNELYNSVLRTFWRAGDTVGAYTAMNGMALVWDATPQKKTIEITMAGIARAIGQKLGYWENRHVIWHVRKLGNQKFGSKVVPLRVPRQQSNQIKWFRRLIRRRMKLRSEILAGEGDVGKKVDELRRVNFRIRHGWHSMKKREEDLRDYWESVPSGLKLPRDMESKAVLSGAIPVDLDKPGSEDENNLEWDSLQAVSDFMREVLFDGTWPEEWLRDAVLTKQQMGLDNEEEINERRMNIFDPD